MRITTFNEDCERILRLLEVSEIILKEIAISSQQFTDKYKGLEFTDEDGKILYLKELNSFSCALGIISNFNFVVKRKSGKIGTGIYPANIEQHKIFKPTGRGIKLND